MSRRKLRNMQRRAVNKNITKIRQLFESQKVKNVSKNIVLLNCFMPKSSTQSAIVVQLNSQNGEQ